MTRLLRLGTLIGFALFLSACTVNDLLEIIGFAPGIAAPIPPASLMTYADIPQTQNAEGFPQLGDPDAPVQIELFTSFACPPCGEFNNTTFVNEVTGYIERGEVFLTFVPIGFTGRLPNGREAAVASVCAAEQGQFGPYKDALFSWAQTYSDEAFVSERLRGGAEALELDMDAWDRCVAGTRASDVIDAAERYLRESNIAGTPMVLLDGEIIQSLSNNLIPAIDAALGQ